MIRSFLDRTRTIVMAAMAALLILTVGQGLWGTLAFVNLKTTPWIPWSVLVMAPLLWLLWQYLGGKGLPQSTSQKRREYLRAKRVPARIFAWSLVAGGCAIVGLAGCWIVMFQLFRMPGNLVPDASRFPLPTLAALLIMSCLAAPFSEEAAFRGYAQGMLERKFSAPTAVLLSSAMFALAHLTQGFLLPKLFVYFLAGLAFGVTARVTGSLLPGIAVHALADLTFFTTVWPYDATRRLVSAAGADFWFWMHVVQAVVFMGLAVAAYRHLATCPAGPSWRSEALLTQTASPAQPEVIAGSVIH